MNSMHKAAALLVGLFCLASTAMAAEVIDVRVESTEGEIRFLLSLDGDPGEPTIFATEQPPRIVLELPGTTSRVSSSPVPVDLGPAQSYTAISAGGRTRLMVDLSRQAPYSVEVAGNQVALVLETGARPVAAPSPAADPVTRDRGDFEIAGFDFRRGTEGEGRILVDLNRPGVSITVNERASGLRVNLFDTRLPERLYQRLDVTDFATPVEMITPEQHNENVRLNIDVAGPFEHLAYQTGGQLIIEVSRAPETPRQDRELTFLEDREYEGARITLNFQDIQVRSVLQLIADVSERNIVVSDSVSGNLTLRLTNVPWDQALDIVLESRNLDMRESGNVIWIAPTQEIAEREQQILRARAERQTLAPLRTVMIPVSYADAGEMASLIRAASEAIRGQEHGRGGLLSDRGSVTVDSRTNTLLVNDTADRIEEIRSLVDELDRTVRQVHIEARIVVARHDFNHELGVRFGVTGARQDSRGNLYSTAATIGGLDQMNFSATQNRRAGTGSSTPVTLPGVSDRMNVNLPASNPAGSLGWSLLTSDFLIDLELSAMESEGRGEIISTPRVIAANQSTASVRQGVQIPFQEATQAGAGTATQFADAFLELEVTPLITPDDRVQMALKVTQNTPGQPLIPGGEPPIDTRELETRVLIDDGQTVVLGGIYQEERDFQSQKVPVLGDVPVMGRLFRRRATEDQKRELLIFVTPTILQDHTTYE